MTATQTETLLQEPEQHVSNNSIPENSLKCTALCPLFAYDVSGHTICRLRTLRQYDDEIKLTEGLPCIATQEDVELLERWVKELDEQKHIIIDLLEEITGQSYDWLRKKQFYHFPFWDSYRR